MRTKGCRRIVPLCALFFFKPNLRRKILDSEMMLFRLQLALANTNLDLVRAKVAQG